MHLASLSCFASCLVHENECWFTFSAVSMEAWFDIGNSYYYCYQILSWFNVLALLGTVVFILFFVCIKCGKIVIDVAMANVYMPFVAITDLTSGQRIKEALQNFLVLFAVLFLCIALVGVDAGYKSIWQKLMGLRAATALCGNSRAFDPVNKIQKQVSGDFTKIG